MITAATVEQINDSLYHTNATKDSKGSLAEKFTKILEDEDVQTITVTIESAGIIMENDAEITIPAGGVLHDRTFNLVFTSTFKKTNGKTLTIKDNGNLDNLNITLPSGNFGKLIVSSDYSKVNVKSAGTTNVEFTAICGTDRTLAIGSGVKANYLPDLTNNKGAVVVNGGEISALIVNSREVTQEKKDGVKTGAKTASNGTHWTKNLIIRGASTVNYSGNWWTEVAASPLEKVTVENNAVLTFNAAAKRNCWRS